MDLVELERLSVLLRGLPEREAETAQICLEFDFDTFQQGITDAADLYTADLDFYSRYTAKKTPHEVEAEFNALAASARDLAAKIRRASQECLNRLEHAALGAEPLIGSEKLHDRAFTDAADLYSWFELHRGYWCEDGSIEEEEPWWGRDGMRGFELEALARVLDRLGEDAAKGKQAPNGPRDGTGNRWRAQERMIWIIWDQVKQQKRPKAHVLPIARKVHEWATGEVCGSSWGERPFERIQAVVKAQGTAPRF